jgi:hypothetical protein
MHDPADVREEPSTLGFRAQMTQHHKPPPQPPTCRYALNGLSLGGREVRVAGFWPDKLAHTLTLTHSPVPATDKR